MSEGKPAVCNGWIRCNGKEFKLKCSVTGHDLNGNPIKINFYECTKCGKIFLEGDEKE